jgi:hypothetical protein
MLFQNVDVDGLNIFYREALSHCCLGAGMNHEAMSATGRGSVKTTWK